MRIIKIIIIVTILTNNISCKQKDYNKNSFTSINKKDSSNKSETIKLPDILSNNSNSITNIDSKTINVNQFDIKVINNELYPIKILHNVNTSSSEYHPSISPDGKTLFFTGMDRTGFFDTKIDFTKTRNAGGEDLFFSNMNNGIWDDAKSMNMLNSSAHQAVTQVLSNGDLIITGNYSENLGPDDNEKGAATTDLFLAKKIDNYKINHFDEPINSIFTETDGFIFNNGNSILFTSDRPGHQGSYHKKGWQWNGSYWGNTDVYVSFKNGDSWTVPKNLGAKLNTEFTERSPWLSKDGLTLFLSSNGYVNDKKDLDIYFFIRKDKNNWDEWDGPYEIANLNGSTDDWGYNEDNLGNGYFAKAEKLGYVPTKKGKDGTGFVFENNFRSGYSVTGLQSGSFQKDEQTDIYVINKYNIAFSLPDILFEVDSYKLNAKFLTYKDEILDFININKPKKITITGYTDSDGTDQHNLTLSLNRAISVKEILKADLNNVEIVTLGKGKENPISPNNDAKGKQKNRRVEISFN
jgi:outer membrane protein OmpA-like peptidoglycan-associated protein